MLTYEKISDAQFNGLKCLILVADDFRSSHLIKKILFALLEGSEKLNQSVYLTFNDFPSRKDMRSLHSLINYQLAALFQAANVRCVFSMKRGYFVSPGVFKEEDMPGDDVTYTVWLARIKYDPQAQKIPLSRTRIMQLETPEPADLLLHKPTVFI